MNKRIIVIIGVCILSLVIAVFLIKGCNSTKVVEQAQILSAGDNKAPVNIKILPRPKSVQKLLELAKAHEANNELLLAREAYLEIISNYPNYPQIQEIQNKIEDLSVKIILSPTLITSSSQYYEVKPGDSLAKISQQFGTTVELIKKINMLSSEIIRPKMQFKVWKGKFSVLVDKSQNMLMLKSDNEVIKSYIVATGRNNSTPVGVFKIVNKLIDPPWFKPGASQAILPNTPENILGSRWMGFDLPSYGIHGTTDPKSLGSQVTDGCVRMKNEDVEELYSFLPQGTEVTIVD